jgi:glycerol dehydrogenase-like iron-containing ADH family enzyme
MKKVILLPRKFILGRGVISEIGTYTAMLGKKTVVLWGAKTKASVGEAVIGSLKAAGVEYTDVHFNGECTKEEANRVAAIAKGHECVIGIGGDKVIDAAKAVAIFAKLPHIIVPTIASVDSLREAAAGRGVSVAEVSINWVLAQEGITSALIGTTKPENLVKNAMVADWELSADELAKINESFKKNFA